MAYKKPEVVAKSESKQSFVAGCPAKEQYGMPNSCVPMNRRCERGKVN